MICEHYACRCARAEELSQIGDRTGQTRYFVEAIGVHSRKVECRMPPEQLQKRKPPGGES